MGLRLQRGQQGPEGSARRQGREPGRDDQPRSAGPAGLHDHHRRLPALPPARRHARRARRPGERAPDRAGEGHGQDPRRPGRPAAGLGAVGSRGLHARDDGDRPQRRAQRRVGARPGRAVGQRAVRLGLLPAADPDVRQDRPRHRRRPVRARPRRGQGRAGHRPGPRPRRRAPPGRRRSLQGHRARSRPARDFPQDPREQMDLAITAVFDSWNADRAVIYRRRERIPGDAGTAVNVCAMVFGNLGRTPAPASRSPATRAAARRASTATTCRTPRARTSWPASATPCR